MSRLTRHYSERQRAALYHQACIRREKQNEERHIWRAAKHYQAMLNNRLYEELDFATFGSWCQSVEIDDGRAYDLARIMNKPHCVCHSLQGMGVSKARLILPHLEGKSEAAQLKFIAAHAHLRWHDLRQALNGDDAEPRYFFTPCPSCGTKLKLGKAASVELA